MAMKKAVMTIAIVFIFLAKSSAQQSILANGDTAIYNSGTGRWVLHPTANHLGNGNPGNPYVMYNDTTTYRWWSPAKIQQWADSVVMASLLPVIDSVDSLKIRNALH